MDQAKIAKQMILFQKTLFENSFSAMTVVQEQTEKMAATMMSQMTWVPDNAKKAMDESITLYKNLRTDFKNAVDDGFKNMEALFNAK